MYENLTFTTRSKSYKELGIAYLGGVATSTKLVHSLSVNVATYGIYLAPSNLSGYHVCPNDKLCKAHCLFGSGQNMMDLLSGRNKITNSRIKKTKLFFENNNLFMQLLVSEISLAKEKSEKNGFFFAVRLNCTSDININDFNLNGKNICEIFPTVSFYDYTKVFSYLENVKKYPNYDITYSFNGQNFDLCKAALDRNVRVAVVFNDRLPKTFHGIEVINGDTSDYRPANEKNVIVGLRFKVTASSIKNHKFVMPKTPFVVAKDNVNSVW